MDNRRESQCTHDTRTIDTCSAHVSSMPCAFVCRLVFINLQPTELKKDSALFIHALLDDVFRDLMKLMQIDVPPFALRRWIRVEQRAVDVGQMQLSVRGVMGSEFDADPIDLFKGVTLVLPSAVTSAKRQRRSRSAVAAAPSTAVAALIESSHSIEPVTGTHTFTVQSLPASQNAFTGVSFTLLLHFYGHKKGQCSARDGA